MNELISQFHFLRPFWLLMIIPCIVLFGLLWDQRANKSGWHKVIAPELLKHLLQGTQTKSLRWPLIALLLAWILTCLAIAGPTWQKQPTPISKSLHPLVVVVDMSYSLLAADIKPDRLTRVRYKLQDLFKLRTNGITAMVAYAKTTHTVAPLTDDYRTLTNLTKALHPSIMPVQGNEPQIAIKLALDLLEQGSNDKGNILLITGSISDTQATEINKLLKKSSTRLSVLGVGTPEGAPISLPKGGYLRDAQGAIIVTKLEQQLLAKLAKDNHGRYQTMTLDNKDIKELIPTPQITDSTRVVERDLDQWHDAGVWLTLLLIPLGLLGFRRGWILFLIIFILPTTQSAHAFGWKDLWLTQDQQAQQLLQQGDSQQAAKLFENPDWKAQTLYQNQQYEEAEKLFSQSSDQQIDPYNEYNRGNTLAKMGKLKQAIEAYDKALEMEPGMQDAQYNRDLVKKLYEQQQNQKKQNDEQQQNQENNDQQQNQENNDQQKNQENNDQQQNQENNDQQQNQQSEEQKGDNNKQNQSKSDDEDKQQQNSKQTGSQNNQEEQQEQDGSQSKTSSNEPTEQNSQTPDQQEQSAEQNQEHQPSMENDKKSPRDDTTKPEELKEQLDNHSQTSDSEHQQPISPEKQAVESWLRTIPDDPGGLLRRKFLQQQRK